MNQELLYLYHQNFDLFAYFIKLSQSKYYINEFTLVDYHNQIDEVTQLYHQSMFVAINQYREDFMVGCASYCAKVIKNNIISYLRNYNNNKMKMYRNQIFLNQEINEELYLIDLVKNNILEYEISSIFIKEEITFYQNLLLLNFKSFEIEIWNLKKDGLNCREISQILNFNQRKVNRVVNKITDFLRKKYHERS